MTTTDSATQTEPETHAAAMPPVDDNDWARHYAALQARYPKVREPIVAALAVLMQNTGIDVDHAKAVAAANGVRITAASVTAAQRLLARQDGGGAPSATEGPRPPSKPTASSTARVRRAQATPAPVDPEALVRGVVAKIRNAGKAETERLCSAMRKAIELLQEAMDA